MQVQMIELWNGRRRKGLTRNCTSDSTHGSEETLSSTDVVGGDHETSDDDGNSFNPTNTNTRKNSELFEDVSLRFLSN